MSSYHGGGFEEWVEDSVSWQDEGERQQHLAELVELLEPARSSVERGIDDYDEETMSWRDHRNTLWSVCVSDNKELDAKVDSFFELLAIRRRDRGALVDIIEKGKVPNSIAMQERLDRRSLLTMLDDARGETKAAKAALAAKCEEATAQHVARLQAENTALATHLADLIASSRALIEASQRLRADYERSQEELKIAFAHADTALAIGDRLVAANTRLSNATKALPGGGNG